MTIVGTRPEVIRLSRVIALLDKTVDHKLVHTGQNYDYELNQIFFDELDLRQPDHLLNVDTSSLGRVLGETLIGIEKVLTDHRPDAVLVLGDTNSCIAALMAKRMRIPTYHMEAGNRCFDERVPEETNRRMIDHVADYNMVYTEHARRNLLAEGIHPSKILLTGSPMREVLRHNAPKIARSNILEEQELLDGRYFLVSLHREENVDDPLRLRSALQGIQALAAKYGFPALVSTHPRTQNRLAQQSDAVKDQLIFHPPFGFHDYVKLQQSAALVLSDSGTISEECAILGFPAITLRDSIERPEALDTGGMITCGVDVDAILAAAAATMAQDFDGERPCVPLEYSVTDTSRRVLNFVLSTAGRR
jgi:UDP-N-acetylglucosamine 2-epimerase (non-hydrolysing)